MRADVVDMYHGDVVQDFRRVKAAGVKGIIHKATQGTGNTDSAYAARRQQALDAGLLWGAYHFNTGEPVASQVQHFLDAAKPDANTLMALDFEDNRASNMTADQAKDFLRRLKAAGIPRPVIYSGNRAKDLLGSHVDTELGSYRLWLAQYGPIARVQPSWKIQWLWQFTGDGIGQPPHSIDGIATRGIDINQYIGDPAGLAADWAGGAEKAPVQPPTQPPTEPPASLRYTGITATEFGGPGDPQHSAYDDTLIDPNEPIAALPGFVAPSRRRIRAFHGDKSVVCRVADKGPHNIDDDYWNHPGARPRAESQHGNRAGIDLTKAAHDALGIPGRAGTRTAIIDWEFVA